MADRERGNISAKTVKKLYALSGNRCAFPDCKESFFSPDNDNDINRSNICHIEAALPGGERYNQDSSPEYRNSYENLILLCPNHHTATNDVQKYTVEELRKMKKSHEDKVMKEGVAQNKLAHNPSVLGMVIQRIEQSEMFALNEESEPKNAPNTEEKISYNHVVRYKYLIEEYSKYQAKLNKLYEEFEAQGLQKRAGLLAFLRSLYLQERGKYSTTENIQAYADDIIDGVRAEMQAAVYRSDDNTELSYELIEMGILVVLVDAFMCCRILEEPSKV
jgi:hypothetical protein